MDCVLRMLPCSMPIRVQLLAQWIAFVRQSRILKCIRTQDGRGRENLANGKAEGQGSCLRRMG